MTPPRLALGAALLIGLTAPARAQGVQPPDLNALTHQMAEQVRHLGEDIASDLGGAPMGAHLLQDTQELSTAVDEFHNTLHDRRDPVSLRQAYSGIDGTWHHLRRQLGQPGNSSPAVERAAVRVDALDTQIHQALDLNQPPPGYYGNGPAPTGAGDTPRLAHALVDRAEGLLTAIRSSRGGDPNPAALDADVANLVRLADTFHDSIDANQPPQAVAQAFAPVDALADRVEQYVTGNAVARPVLAAWQAFASVEVLIHQNLGLASAQPVVPVNPTPPPGGGPSPVLPLADELAGQTNAFLQVFAPHARVVPQGAFMLADTQRLQAAAVGFRDDVARGLDAGQLAYEFRDVDAAWQTLARRVNRVAQGRMGPNIAQVQKLGAICEQIHQTLGMPGFPPILNGPAFNQ